MSKTTGIGDEGEHALLDGWIEEGCPEPEAWLAEHCDDWTPALIKAKAKVGRPSRKEADELPPSELVHQYALTMFQAGKMIGGMSPDWVKNYVLKGPGRVRTIKRGQAVLLLTSDLLRWLDENSRAI